MENPKDPEGPPQRVRESGFGLADVFLKEFNYERFVVFFDVELVHLARSGRYYSSGLGSLGIGFVFIL